jgi:hypothetical protein
MKLGRTRVPISIGAGALAAIAFLVVAHFVYASGPITLYVDDDSSCVSLCGSQTDPYPTIQEAINDANAQIGAATATEATIDIAPGYYGERIFIFPDIHVQCDSPATVTIDGTGFARSAVIFASGGTGRAKTNFSIDGCTITGGSGEERINVTLIAGGGIFIIGNPVVSNNVIRDNIVSGPQPDYDGGGIYIESGMPVITGNTIMHNVVDPPPLGGQNVSFGLGGGIYVLGPLSSVNAVPRIEGNIFIDNFAGGQIGKGGAIRIDGALGAEFTRNLLIGNRASLSGGGIAAYNDVLISDNLIYGNSALIFGGGIDTLQSSIQVTSNTIVGNSLTETSAPSGYYYANYGGGINVRALIAQVPPEVNLTNNLIAGNTIYSEGVGAGIYSLLSYPVITHTDSWDNIRLPGTTINIEGDFTEIDFLLSPAVHQRPPVHRRDGGEPHYDYGRGRGRLPLHRQPGDRIQRRWRAAHRHRGQRQHRGPDLHACVAVLLPGVQADRQLGRRRLRGRGLPASDQLACDRRRRQQRRRHTRSRRQHAHLRQRQQRLADHRHGRLRARIHRSGWRR